MSYEFIFNLIYVKLTQVIRGENMNRFVNEFYYGKNESKDICYTYWRNRQSKPLAILMVILSLLCYFYFKNIIFILFLLSPVGIYLIFSLRARNENKIVCERIDMMNEGNPRLIKTIVEDDMIHGNNDKEIKIEFKDIRYYIENKKLFMIVAKGNLITVLYKDKFLEGTPEEFSLFLKSKFKKRN